MFLPFSVVRGMSLIKRAHERQPVPHPSKPDMKVLANPLKIDGKRLVQKACAPLGHDNAVLLHDISSAEENGPVPL